MKVKGPAFVLHGIPLLLLRRISSQPAVIVLQGAEKLHWLWNLALAIGKSLKFLLELGAYLLHQLNKRVVAGVLSVWFWVEYSLVGLIDVESCGSDCYVEFSILQSAKEQVEKMPLHPKHL
jgi:hypothetical protein